MTSSSFVDGVKIASMTDVGIPLLIARADSSAIDLPSWWMANRAVLEEALHKAGATLFRGFGVDSEDSFEEVVSEIGGQPLDYRFGSTPRTRAKGGIYTSSEYPADQSIPQHNEMSYTNTWPGLLWFWCALPADEGGQTPLSDSRRVLRRIPAAIVCKFREQGVSYRRNFSRWVDLPWQQAFETDSRVEVESYCREHGIAYEWKSDEQLVTTQVCQAVARHPVTGEEVWFNQAHLFHPSHLGEMRATLEDALGADNLPRQAMYGSGDAIPDDVIVEISSAYDKETVAFDWEPHDVLLIDNVLAAHGRCPFLGARRVLVAMTA